VTSRIRIVLADDHPIILNGLRNLIQAERDFDLVGEASDGIVALKLIREQRPEVAVLDISMPQLNGLLLSSRLASELPSVKLLFLTLHEDRAYVRQALSAGACGYVLKRSAAENLVQAIRAVARGGLYLDPAIADRVIPPASRRAGRPKGGSTRDITQAMALPDLTEREAEVLKLAAMGFTNKEIAGQLDVGVKSVETYKARGSEKLGLRTRAELVRYASAQGWLAGI
jgi:DNA-binding NarL/FixJ family response regulator